MSNSETINKLKMLISDGLFNWYSDYLRDELKVVVDRLKKEKDISEIRYLQGFVNAIEYFTNIKTQIEILEGIRKRRAEYIDDELKI